MIALLAGYEGQKLSLVVSCGDETQVSATDLLSRQLAPLGGGGDGNDQLAQGGGQATVGQVATFFAKSKDYVKRLARGE